MLKTNKIKIGMRFGSQMTSRINNSMTHQHTVKAIAEDTGLTVNFIRRIVNKSKIVKKEYSKRSTTNELLFNDNGFVYFRESAKLKADGYTLSDLVDKLDQSIESSDTPPDKPIVKTNDMMLELVLNGHAELIKAKDQIIAQLESKVLLLTESRAPDQSLFERQQLELERKEIERMKRELEDQKQAVQAKRQALIDELARVSWFQWGRKADLIQQLRELDR